ncbi:hypothetical protein M758_4G258900 [Ceratodon purpureus]|uniref:Uncharacterized protein n=1 Tax=Ceratodon purpureus TaxID=3225 RepID=A0A8T0IDP3_CERPU|nr:hypothetical protein KC19_4G258100 [Ceratodon purpureus]KAG0620974.1 hypothetical protein M758_4G258900 [Ceratodon purpureus]
MSIFICICLKLISEAFVKLGSNVLTTGMKNDVGMLCAQADEQQPGLLLGL